MAYVRTVRTSSGATAVQIVHSSRKGSRTIEHLGSAHTPEEVAALEAVAAHRLVEGRAELDLGPGGGRGCRFGWAVGDRLVTDAGISSRHSRPSAS